MHCLYFNKKHSLLCMVDTANAFHNILQTYYKQGISVSTSDTRHWLPSLSICDKKLQANSKIKLVILIDDPCKIYF